MPSRSVNRPVPPAPVQNTHSPRWLKPVVLALSAFLLMGWFSTEISNSDTWWHLKTGQYLWQKHALPVPDPFAFTTAMGKQAYPGEATARYFNLTHEWLSQLVLYLAYASGGFAGLILLRAAVLTAFCGVVGLITFHRSQGFYKALAAALTAATVADKYLLDRPYLFSFLLLAVTILILEYRRWLWLLPPLFLVWSNLHGGYFLGWVALGAYCFEAILLRWRGKPDAGERKLWIIALVSALASGLNPNFFNVFPVLFAYRKSAMQTSLYEWQHTALWPPDSFHFVLLSALAALLWARRRSRPVDWLFLLAFTAAAIWAVRNVMLIGLIGPILIFCYLPWKRTVPMLAEFLIGFLLLAGAGAEISFGRAFQLRAADWKYPVGAADFLIAHHVTAPMFNTYEYGGYLMWRLWPQEKVFIDGRALNESVYLDYQRIAGNADTTGGKSGDELREQYGIQVLVMPGFEYISGSPYLLPAALADPRQKDWKLVYVDSQAMIFMRQPPADVQPRNSLDALAGMEMQCAEYMTHDPQRPRCARGLSSLFARLGDVDRARQWMGRYLEHRVEADPEAERMYGRMVTGAPQSTAPAR